MRLIDADALLEVKFHATEREYQLGWNDALESIAENAPTIDAVPGRWISVNDRLPEPFETVLVQMPLENPLPTVGWGFIKGDGEWYCNHFNRDKDEVTHWMPLPEPPEEE